MGLRVGVMGFVLGMACSVSGAAIAQEASAELADDEGAIAAGEADSDARAIYVAGRVAFDAGRYDEALARFEEAYDRSGRAELLYNIGMAADRLRRDETALAAFEGYLSQVEDADNRVSVENRVRALREILADREDTVPSPQETAAATPVESEAEAEPFESEPADDDGGSVLTSWWLWTIVGVVVVGGVVAGVAVAASSGDTTQAAMPGDFGVVVMALGGP